MARSASSPFALCGDFGLGASRAAGVDHQGELHQRVAAVSELVVLAGLHPRQLEGTKKDGEQARTGESKRGKALGSVHESLSE